jgi:hypothetical protein
MRYLKILFLSLALIGLMVGSTFAGTIAVSNPFTTAAEGIAITCAANMDLDTGVATPLGTAGLGSFITYTPGIALNIGDKLTFTLTNATFRDAAYFLLVDEDQAAVGDIDGDTVVTELQEVGNWISGGSGTSSVTIRIANYNVPATWVLYLVSSNAIANTGADVDVTAATDQNIIIRLNCGLTNGSLVTLKVENSEDVGGTPLTGADAPAATIIDVETQFAITFTRGTSIIDVTSPSLRTNFIEEGGADDIITSVNDTDLAASSGVVIVTNDANSSIEDFINLATYPAALELTLGAVANIYTALDFGNARVYVDADAVSTTNGANYAFNAVTHIATVPAGVFTVAQGAVWTDDVYIGVDGINLLTTQVWPLTATVNFTNANITDPTATDLSFVTWTINGYQAVIPYITTNPLYPTICVANNTSTAAADVMVDILSSETGTIGTNLDVGEIAGLSTVRLDFAGQTVSNAVAGSAAIPLGVAERYSVRLTITADQNQVYVNCLQAEPTGFKRMVPVLTDDTSINWRN